MSNEAEKLSVLEEGLLAAMQALDHQIAKAVQRRTPEELESQGVQKWEPYGTRVERVASFVLNALGEQQAGLDSIIVLAQAFAKSLQLVIGDIGEEGLGKVRTAYCIAALQAISTDVDRASHLLEHRSEGIM